VGKRIDRQKKESNQGGTGNQPECARDLGTGTRNKLRIQKKQYGDDEGGREKIRRLWSWSLKKRNRKKKNRGENSKTGIKDLRSAIPCSRKKRGKTVFDRR